jgi:3-deoxy-D-manno-octulosonate 8-phosphate phosphatase (KDO 8-P phosphatase)
MLDNEQVQQKAKAVRLLICDVDGVLTPGQVVLDNEQGEQKAFNIKDGLGIKLLQQAGIEVAIITGRESNIVTRRMAELGVKHVYQGQKNKIAAYEGLLSALNIAQDQVAYMGDDLPDLPLMRRSGLGIAVADASSFVLTKADTLTKTKGGFGAVREIAEMILSAQHKLDEIHEDYWQQ